MDGMLRALTDTPAGQFPAHLLSKYYFLARELLLRNARICLV